MPKIFAVLLSFVFLSILLVVFVINQAEPLPSTISRNFVVNQGDSIDTISKRLEANGLIKNRFVFLVYSYFLGLNKKLQAGTFYLSPSQGTKKIIVRLSQGGSDDYWLKIIDGFRVEEITLSDPTSAKIYEGQLYPDSYLIPKVYTQPQIIDLILKNFNQKLTQAKADQSTTLTDAQSLVLASILEREGKSLDSKQVIAGILLNRLKINMALQIDATVQYARDSRRLFKGPYWKPLAKSDLKIVSPFNTYLNPGLPPSPICNPGYDSLFAAYHPTDSDYLFYITDDTGQMHYAKTLDDHNLNVAKYLK